MVETPIASSVTGGVIVQNSFGQTRTTSKLEGDIIRRGGGTSSASSNARNRGGNSSGNFSSATGPTPEQLAQQEAARQAAANAMKQQRDEIYSQTLAGQQLPAGISGVLGLPNVNQGYVTSKGGLTYAIKQAYNQYQSGQSPFTNFFSNLATEKVNQPSFRLGTEERGTISNSTRTDLTPTQIQLQREILGGTPQGFFLISPEAASYKASEIGSKTASSNAQDTLNFYSKGLQQEINTGQKSLEQAQQEQKTFYNNLITTSQADANLISQNIYDRYNVAREKASSQGPIVTTNENLLKDVATSILYATPVVGELYSTGQGIKGIETAFSDKTLTFGQGVKTLGEAGLNIGFGLLPIGPKLGPTGSLTREIVAERLATTAERGKIGRGDIKNILAGFNDNTLIGGGQVLTKSGMIKPDVKFSVIAEKTGKGTNNFLTLIERPTARVVNDAVGLNVEMGKELLIVGGKSKILDEIPIASGIVERETRSAFKPLISYKEYSGGTKEAFIFKTKIKEQTLGSYFSQGKSGNIFFEAGSPYRKGRDTTKLVNMDYWASGNKDIGIQRTIRGQQFNTNTRTLGFRLGKQTESTTSSIMKGSSRKSSQQYLKSLYVEQSQISPIEAGLASAKKQTFSGSTLIKPTSKYNQGTILKGQPRLDYQTKEKLNYRTVEISQSALRSQAVLLGYQNQVMQPRQVQRYRQGTFPIETQALKTAQVQLQTPRLALRTAIPNPVPTGFNPTPPSFAGGGYSLPPIIPFVPQWPGGMGSSGKASKFKAKGFSYQPSFTAVTLNIRGGMLPKKIMGGFDPSVFRTIAPRSARRKRKR